MRPELQLGESKTRKRGPRESHVPHPGNPPPPTHCTSPRPSGSRTRKCRLPRRIPNSRLRNRHPVGAASTTPSAGEATYPARSCPPGLGTRNTRPSPMCNAKNLASQPIRIERGKILGTQTPPREQAAAIDGPAVARYVARVRLTTEWQDWGAGGAPGATACSRSTANAADHRSTSPSMLSPIPVGVRAEILAGKCDLFA